jgi:formate C-acetyltransferase
MRSSPPPLTERVLALDAAIRAAAPALCAERALLVTRYFKGLKGERPMAVQKAEALSAVLRGKVVRIWPGELLVGCFTSHRVGGGLYPELHGVAVLEDLLRMDSRAVNPLTIDPGDRRRLLIEVLPYWAPRMLAVRGRPLLESIRFVADQLAPTFHLVNESGGVAHLVPDYARLVAQGTDGLRREAAERQAVFGEGTPEADFLGAVRIACDGLDAFADRYRAEAERQAAIQQEPASAAELGRMAQVCARVPRQGARSFHEALQSILFAQIALNLESLDNAISPGRLDQILWGFFEADLAAGRITPGGALELLACFALKLCEIVPAFSRRLTRFHGGLFNGQVVVVGGLDRSGHDATNDLSYLCLELMDRLRTRQPNWHARLSPASPATYRRRIAAALAAGAVSPALYNDQVIVPLVRQRAASDEDARDYATVGCVEPVVAGKSFWSTDAALFNLPLCLELALNRGRRFGGWRRLGAATGPAERCGSVAEVVALLRAQLEHAVGRLLTDLHRVEAQNARWHPTPLTSALLDGCLASGRDASSGGATYNGSGVQGVGLIEVGDALAALDQVVFRRGQASMAEVVDACRRDFRGREALRARLRAAPKYGNDDPAADGHVAEVMRLFAGALSRGRSARGGGYVAGFYSVTAHQAFGEEVGALPSGRRAKAPFSSGLSPGSGADRKGPTAALLSQAHLPLSEAKNGVNFNLQLAPWAVQGEAGATWLQALVDGGFAAGCMQLQVNVLDPKILVEARDHPGRYPGLLVRVSGYSAYFDDLAPSVKQEIIERTLHEGSAGRGGSR